MKPFQLINSTMQSSIHRAKEWIENRINDYPGEELPTEEWWEETFEAYDIPDELKDFFITITNEVITLYDSLHED